jgi:valyl-tRNA synthetase
MIAPYPGRAAVDEAWERSFGPVIGIIDALRNIRGEMNIPFKTVLRGVEVGALGAEAVATLEQERGRILRLANAEGLRFLPAGQATRRRAGCAVGVGSGFEVRVPLTGLVDMAAETARIEKEIVKVEADLAGVEGKLANPSFVEKAPAEVVEKDRARAEELRDRRRKLEAHRALLAGAEEVESEPGPMTTRTATTTAAAITTSTSTTITTATMVPTATLTPPPTRAATTTLTSTPARTSPRTRRPRTGKKAAPAKKAKRPARRGARARAGKTRAGGRPPPKRRR